MLRLRLIFSQMTLVTMLGMILMGKDRTGVRMISGETTVVVQGTHGLGGLLSGSYKGGEEEGA